MASELSGESEDEDVQRERERILENAPELLNSTVLVKELTKVMLFNGQLMMVLFPLKSRSLVSRTHCDSLGSMCTPQIE